MGMQREPTPDALALAVAAAIPGFTRRDLDAGWSMLGLDSFDLVSLRLAVEQALGSEISDEDWVAAATPGHLFRLAARTTRAGSAPEASSFSIAETVELAMPQMALGGLSESWLLKMLGDLHWRLIAAALGTRSSDIRDGLGNRLYPAFTRVRYVASQPLAAFAEGEALSFRASLSRFGGSLYFSAVSASGARGRAISADLMSSFTLRGASGRNIDLLRGQPALPPPARVPVLGEMPVVGAEYGRRRAEKDAARPVLDRSRYELLPQYDINGVGLLYYAAYPLIADICQMRRSPQGAGWASATSPLARDAYYFANADITSVLEWRLHRDDAGDGLCTESSIVRDDGVVMAYIESRKAST